MAMTSFPEELTDIIQRREGVKIGPTGQPAANRK
jgi:hypothetical protein